jgi:hypothetical protein
MKILQNRLVYIIIIDEYKLTIVQLGQLILCLDKVSIVKPWMLVVMNHSSNKIAKHFQISHLA